MHACPPDPFRLDAAHALFDAFDLGKVCTDRPPPASPEWHESNDYYGIATTLKLFAGLPASYTLKTSITHGFIIQNVWSLELQAPLPVMTVMDQPQALYLKTRSSKAVFGVGPYLHYARPQLPPEATANLKTQLGRTLLVTLPHSTHHVDFIADADLALQAVAPLANQYDTVLILAYWKDVLAGRLTPYQAAGFLPVSAGHMYDLNFLPRLKSIFALADAAFFMGRGSQIPFWMTTGKPFCYQSVDAHVQSQAMRFEARSGHSQDVTPASELRQLYDDQLCQNFGSMSSPTPDNMAYFQHHCGLDCLRQPEELRSLFLIAESLYQGWKPGQKRDLSSIADTFFDVQRYTDAELLYHEQRLRHLGSPNSALPEKAQARSRYCQERLNGSVLALNLWPTCPRPEWVHLSSVENQELPAPGQNPASSLPRSLPRPVVTYPATWPLPWPKEYFSALLFTPNCPPDLVAQALPLLQSTGLFACLLPSVDLPTELAAMLLTAPLPALDALRPKFLALASRLCPQFDAQALLLALTLIRTHWAGPLELCPQVSERSHNLPPSPALIGRQESA